MSNKKLTIKEKCQIVHESNQKTPLELISGKWFIGDHELKQSEVYRYFDSNVGIDDPNEKEKLYRQYRDMYGDDNDGRWKPLEIISYAKNNDFSDVKLPIELNTKQHKIINALLNDYECFFILTGVGGSGKSTFLNIIKQIYNNDVSASTLSDISNGFCLADALKHRLICSDELNADDLNNGRIKTICSRQPTQINEKYGAVYTILAQSSMIFSCNTPPKFNLSDSGMMRRVIYYRMDKKIQKPDPAYQNLKLTTREIACIVKQSLNVDMRDWRADFEQETRETLLKNNSVYIVHEYDTYSLYRESCQEKGYKPFAENNWRDIVSLIREWDADKKVSDEKAGWKYVGEYEELPF